MFRKYLVKICGISLLMAGPVSYTHLVETALQLAVTELSENLRDIYVEAYTFPATAEIIHRSTTAELQAAFSAYLPGCAECDFCLLYTSLMCKFTRFMLRLTYSSMHIARANFVFVPDQDFTEERCV